MTLWYITLWIKTVNKYPIHEILIFLPFKVYKHTDANRFIFPTQPASSNDKPWHSIALNN